MATSPRLHSFPLPQTSPTCTVWSMPRGRGSNIFLYFREKANLAVTFRKVINYIIIVGHQKATGRKGLIYYCSHSVLHV